MTLQLPERAAPPISDTYNASITMSSPITSSSPASRQRRKSSSHGGPSSSSGSSSKTRTARPPASPFIVSGKAASSPLLASKARSMALHGHGHAQLHNGSVNGHDEISSMTDVRRLEDMLSHNESLMSNATLCAQLPGGTANVEARNKAMKDRLEHLYAMHAINIQMQDRVAIQEDDNPFMEDDDMPDTSKSNITSVQNVKEEEFDDVKPVKGEDYAPQYPVFSPHMQDGFVQSSQSRSHINGSPPLSSSPTNGSPGAFHRHWKENIANRTTMVGKVGQLSMDESLSLLQTRANHRLRAQAELERLAAERGSQSHLKKGSVASTGDIQTVNTNDTEFTLPEEEEDYDYYTAGYYHEDEDAP